MTVETVADEYTPYEQQLADRISEAAAKPQRAGEIALAIGASFLLYRTFMKRRIKEEVAANPPDTVEDVTRLVNLVAQAYMPRWLPTLAISLGAGFASGLKEAGQLSVNNQWAYGAAQRYAASLGMSVHETSTSALVDGIRAQINRGVVARAAIGRTIDAFGVAPRTMNALVSLWTKTPAKSTTSRSMRNPVADQIDKTISKAITERAKTIGSTEAHLSKNVAKSLYWTYLQENGQLPSDSQKQWVTAKDELVCPVCGPLHKQSIPLSEKFTLPDGRQIVAPGVHPRCRCYLKLLNTKTSILDYAKDDFALAKRDTSVWGVVSKARGTDTYDRDASGKFAATESRGGPKHEPNRRLRYIGERPQSQEPRQEVQEPAQEENTFGEKFGTGFEAGYQPGFKTGFKAKKKQATEFKPTAQFAKQEQFRFQEAFQARQADFQQVQRFQMAAQFELAHDEFDDEIDEESTAFHYMMTRHGSNFGMIDFAADDQSTVLEQEYADSQLDDEVSNIGYEFFSEMADHFEESEAGSWEDARYEDANFEGEPDEEWLSSQDADELAESEYTKGERFISLSKGGYTLYLDAEGMAELAQNVYNGFDDTIDVRWSAGGTGFAATDQGAYAEKTFTTSEILDMLGDSGEELKTQLVDMRLVDVVCVDRSYDDDDFDPTMADGVEAHFDQMQEDPFNTELVSKGSFLY